jgi:hypothetical protein
MLISPHIKDVKPDVSLSAWNIWDQHKLDCCMSCALVTCIEAFHNDWPPLAPLFHYFHSRRFSYLLEGLDELQAFSGATRCGFAALPLHNVVFDTDGAKRVPSQQADIDGKTRLFLAFTYGWIAPYRSVFIGDREYLWKESLNSGKPVYLGLHLDSTYEEMREKKSPPIWKNSGRTLPEAYHAVAILGYADSVGCFIVQDSHGICFFQEGQWYLPYKVVQSERIRFAYSIGV